MIKVSKGGRPKLFDMTAPGSRSDWYLVKQGPVSREERALFKYRPSQLRYGVARRAYAHLFCACGILLLLREIRMEAAGRVSLGVLEHSAHTS